MLDQLDKTIFLFLNSLNSPFMDRVMWAVSGKLTWLPLYVFILVLIGIKYKKKILIIIPLIALAITITDQVSVHAFKEVFERLRPCHEPTLQGIVHLVNDKCGGQYGFVSSHAANSFGAALLSLLLIRKKWFTCLVLVWAILVGYSRIYLGVHYPGDVIGGATVGAITGWIIYLFYRWIDKKYLRSILFFNNDEKC
ncbi:MAG: phosphatase PAP2 family protein [Bacteroidales bacterium]|nr:phosphatase PAP2 family protein [Bacteroidales bacterium]